MKNKAIALSGSACAVLILLTGCSSEEPKSVELAKQPADATERREPRRREPRPEQGRRTPQDAATTAAAETDAQSTATDQSTATADSQQPAALSAAVAPPTVTPMPLDADATPAVAPVADPVRGRQVAVVQMTQLRSAAGALRQGGETANLLENVGALADNLPDQVVRGGGLNDRDFAVVDDAAAEASRLIREARANPGSTDLNALADKIEKLMTEAEAKLPAATPTP